MDGNRRWARQRGMPALYGHQRGAETLKAVTRHAHGRGIRWLTAFAFSFENWSRPKPEVDGLLGLLRGFLENDVGVLNEENVKLRVIGNRSRFTPRLGKLIDWAEHETAANTGINLTLALDYGGRQDITSAARKLANEVANGMLSGRYQRRHAEVAHGVRRIARYRPVDPYWWRTARFQFHALGHLLRRASFRFVLLARFLAW